MLFSLYKDFDNYNYFMVYKCKFVRLLDVSNLYLPIEYLLEDSSFLIQPITAKPKSSYWYLVEEFTPESHPELFI
jgi:hypothetical protein